MTSKSPVYVYHFGYRGANSLTQLGVNEYPPKRRATDILYGVGNGDDLIYLFPILSGSFRPLPHDDLVFSQVYPLSQAYFLSILRKTQNKNTLTFSKTQPIFPKNSPKLT